MAKDAEVTDIPIDGVPAHLGAIAYLAVLAYPSREDWSKRNKLLDATKAWLIKDYYIPHGGDRTRIKVNYLTARPRDYHSTLAQAIYRIQAWRLPAAMMARWIMLHGVRVGPFVINVHNPKDKRWAPTGVSAAAERMAELLDAQRSEWQHYRSRTDVGWECPNVLHRVWASTLPVLHLALAFPFGKGQKTDPFLLVHKPFWLGPALLHAELARQSLREQIPTFDPQKAVRLLPC